MARIKAVKPSHSKGVPMLWGMVPLSVFGESLGGQACGHLGCRELLGVAWRRQSRERRPTPALPEEESGWKWRPRPGTRCRSRQTPPSAHRLATGSDQRLPGRSYPSAAAEPGGSDSAPSYHPRQGPARRHIRPRRTPRLEFCSDRPWATRRCDRRQTQSRDTIGVLPFPVW